MNDGKPVGADTQKKRVERQAKLKAKRRAERKAGNKPAAARKADGKPVAEAKAPTEMKPEAAAVEKAPEVVQPPKPTPIIPPQPKPRRHRGLVLSFLLMVAIPLGATGFYLWSMAKDQYSSVTGFTVRQEESGGASELLGGLAQLTGGSSSSDGDILYEFILSQSLVRAIDEDLSLRAHYSLHWDEDPVFALKHDSSIEELERYWQRIVSVSFDQGAGLIEVRVLAFEPQMAQDITTAIVERSQDMINALNTQARDDAIRYARQDLEQAVEFLKETREALTGFRIRTQIVDPEADLQGRLGVMNNLQQQLAEAFIELDLLLSNTTGENDPRLVQARTRVAVIQDRIVFERESFANGDSDGGPETENYPTLIAEFESLTVEREYAEEAYRAALTAMTVARAQADRQSRYLATYVTPTLAEESEYPQRGSIFGLMTLFLLLSWSILVLVYYSIRDRS